VSEESTVGNERENEYQLNHELDGSSFAVRENLVDIIERELLGPINGEEEVLPFSPRSQYLVGHIAPVKLTGTGDPTAAEDTDEEPDLIEDRSDRQSISEGRGVPTSAEDENEADSEDDDKEDRAPKQGLMIPASMGLRFQIPADLEEFTVTASWGKYSAFESEEETADGRKVRHYQREPVEETVTIRPAELVAGETRTEPLREFTCLRVDRYDDHSLNRTLVEIALCNDRQTPTPIPIGMWMFQTKLRVEAGGEEVFLPVQDVTDPAWNEHDHEKRQLALQYRNRLEFAIGRTCSADWQVEPGSRRASSVWTTWLPQSETPQTRARPVEGAMLSMKGLVEASREDLSEGLEPLISGYASWLDEQDELLAQLPDHLKDTAAEAINSARQVQARLAAGLEHLLADDEALTCFRFMNRVMREQRIATQVSAMRAANAELSIEEARGKVLEGGPKMASWYPFQLAFILMQLGGLTDPSNQSRSANSLAQVELLFFPTGGGKTEAYLGLAAYTFAIRRRQGIVDSSEGPLDGNDGVAVLMRYTLRLLTTQQFQRATALMCAAELVRRDDEETWGTVPFRIGLWVGTDVSPKRFKEADEQLKKANQEGQAHRLTLLQIQRCPWCGTPITPGDAVAREGDQRVLVYCGDDLRRCPFSKGGEVDEGLPMLTVDEEIYRLVPSLVIGTVDKFARLAREGEAATLFGYVGRKCGRHGYVHPDYQGCGVSSHPAKDGMPQASVVQVGRLRPPDLIIQDELHLITGALGTSVGLFEVVVDTLCSWEAPEGKPVKPMIVASTATIRNAAEQVWNLYGRHVEVFPPQVLDVADTYFSQEVPISQGNPGRLYLGVSAQGVRLSSAEIRVAEILMLAGQLLFDRAGAAADPYMTLVGYFNATRELAGMARYVADDVRNRIRRPRKDSGFAPRYGTDYTSLSVGELTSRISSRDIGRALDQLAVGFDPEFDTTEAFLDRVKALREEKEVPNRRQSPLDVVLATSMLQVGVDVQRLGLMLVVGQPKNTAEYIQASSRVGRDASNRPGLVVSLGNWARPRDLAHFEQFRHYHETFYSQVEALSVTPFSPTSLDRGTSGLLVSAARVTQAPEADGLSPEKNAGRIEGDMKAVEAILARLEKRIEAAARDPFLTNRAKDTLANRLERWVERASYAKGLHQGLAYEKAGNKNDFATLLISPENVKSKPGDEEKPPFEVANSMREVQPEINVLVSPVEQRLYALPPKNAPDWTLPSEGGHD